MNKEEELHRALAKVRLASRALIMTDEEVINGVLAKLADLLEKNVDIILTENKKDLDAMNNNDPIYDRVLLDQERVMAIAESVREIANYESPVGIELEAKTLENGLELRKVSTPIGVVGAIFEARPNVVIDIFAICFKARNSCVMKGGSKSAHSNSVMAEFIIEALGAEMNDNFLLLNNDREQVKMFLHADEYVDVIVPRGSKELINFVRENAKIPVIETGAGVCHTYFDESADLEMGMEILFNAKTTRPSVCNALDTLIIHSSRLDDLPELCKKLDQAGVEIFADEDAFGALDGKYEFLRHVENFGIEFLSLKMSVKVVDSLDEAIDHINTYGSKHSEAILTEDNVNAEKFLKTVDAAAVYVNASTRFTDGGVFGLGAEVGISTQKLHARGPMGIKELTSYKWQITGNGQVR